MHSFITPNWPPIKGIHAASTTRIGGVSSAPYDSFNLGFGGGDIADNVLKNRHLLCKSLNLPNQPRWLSQIHSTCVIQADDLAACDKADASYTQQLGTVCVAMSADCMPVLFATQDGTWVAAAHAGWRGLAAGILEKTALTAAQSLDQIQVWLGPAIGADAFEVGIDVYDAFLAHDQEAATCFKPTLRPNFFYADLYALARRRLNKIGISAIYGGQYCTFTQAAYFFSYRRDGQQSGRMASLIWRG